MTPTDHLHHPPRRRTRLLRAGPLGIAFAAVLLAACTTSGSGASPSPESTASAATPVTTASPSASAESTTEPTASATTEPTGEPTASPSPSAGTVDPRADGLDVAFGEFAVTLEASAVRPGPVTFVVHNAGQLTHGFEMRIERSGSGSGSGSGGDRDKIETRTFRSGETLRVEADLEPGVYEIECFVSDHDDRGMRALLEVRDDAPLVAAGPGGADVGTTRIVQFAFVAADMEVPAGTRLTWVNDDPAPHTVTADDGTFDSGQLDQGGRYSVVLDTPGTFAYHCDIHPTMVGTVRVH